MTWSLLFFTTNIFLGIGLAMDAFSVSMANGLNEPHMNKGRVCTIAGVFGGFQALMPLIGWFCVHTIAESFHVFEKFIPWIALNLHRFHVAHSVAVKKHFRHSVQVEYRSYFLQNHLIYSDLSVH